MGGTAPLAEPWAADAGEEPEAGSMLDAAAMEPAAEDAAVAATLPKSSRSIPVGAAIALAHVEVVSIDDSDRD